MVLCELLTTPVGKSVSLVWQRRSRAGETGVKGAGTMGSDADIGNTTDRERQSPQHSMIDNHTAFCER